MKITRYINVISVVLFCLVNSAAICAGEIKQAALKPQVLIKNVNVWDGKRDSVQTGMNVLVEGNFIKSVSEDASLETFNNPEQVPGFGPVQIAKAQQVYENARKVPVWLKKYGVKTVGGADLYTWNTIDFLMDDIVIKQEWYTPAEVLRMHTSTAGEVLAMSGPMNPYREGKLGVIEPGAYADVILWDGNPLEELEILKQGQLLRLVMKDGTIYKNTLAQ